MFNKLQESWQDVLNRLRLLSDAPVVTAVMMIIAEDEIEIVIEIEIGIEDAETEMTVEEDEMIVESAEDEMIVEGAGTEMIM